MPKINLVGWKICCYICYMNHSENGRNLEVGDIITFTNNNGYKVRYEVSRVTEKSWYQNNNRWSYGSLESMAKYPDFKIEKTAKATNE